MRLPCPRLQRPATDRCRHCSASAAAAQTFSNEYFKRLLEDKWVERKWTGPRQLTNAGPGGGDLMMLPADVALTADPAFR